MTIIVVPYHQDQRLTDRHVWLPPTGKFLVLDPDLPDGELWTRLVALHDAAAEQIAAAVRLDEPTTVVSGDCLLGTAVLAGAQRAGVHPGVVWFDAHGDVHTLATSTSGYLGGTSLRLLLGGDPDKLTGPLGVQPITEDRALLVGARDLDPAEEDYLAGSRVRRSDVPGLTAADLPDGPLILHIDIDVADPEGVPGLLFPAPGGPTVDELSAAVHTVLATGRVTVLSIACTWHPSTDDRVQNARTELLRELTRGERL